jgi:putative transposase
MPEGFVVKQVRIMRKADKWYASISIQCDVNVPSPIPYGHPIGVDTGLEKFLATSDGVLIKPPKFFKTSGGDNPLERLTELTFHPLELFKKSAY